MQYECGREVTLRCVDSHQAPVSTLSPGLPCLPPSSASGHMRGGDGGERAHPGIRDCYAETVQTGPLGTGECRPLKSRRSPASSHVPRCLPEPTRSAPSAPCSNPHRACFRANPSIYSPLCSSRPRLLHILHIGAPAPYMVIPPGGMYEDTGSETLHSETARKAGWVSPASPEFGNPPCCNALRPEL